MNPWRYTIVFTPRCRALQRDLAAPELDHVAADADGALGHGQVQRRGTRHGLALCDDAPHRLPGALTGMIPARISSLTASPAEVSERTTCAVPSVGCPANGISYAGVKMRTRAVAVGDGRMNVVSERLN